MSYNHVRSNIKKYFNLPSLKTTITIDVLLLLINKLTLQFKQMSQKKLVHHWVKIT